jgi:uncharacterized protein involved in type VI secretion and phage assembly
MNLLDALLEPTDAPPADGRLIFGLVVGVVTNGKDPDNLGRVKVRFPWLSDSEDSQWARIAVLMGGKDRGTYFLPEVDDEVLLAFERGDPRFPYVIGALWNGKDTPPASNADGKNNVRLIKSRSGHVIKLNDEHGKETIEIVDKSGNNSLVIDTAKNTLTITTSRDIALTASQGKISLEARTIELKSSTSLRVEAGAGMDLKASATVNVKGATVNIN